MAVVTPFRGMRYNPDKIENMDDVVTPPYDVISEEAGASFLEKNPYNMIQLDLRNTSQQAAESTARYTDARTRFEQWQQENILIRDENPSMYLYYIDYTHPSGRKMTRKGIVALAGLADFSEGVVKPHEQTFEGVISDRLALMDECKAQFSQVFSMYQDPEQEIIQTLEEAREPGPLVQVKDYLGNMHIIWRVSNPDVLKKVQQLFAAKTLYIADGHHRYTTALAYQRRIRERTPDLPATSPFNFIMMYLCASEDEGMSILPTHRLVNIPGEMTADSLSGKLSSAFDAQEVSGGTRETIIGEILARMNEEEMVSKQPIYGVYHAGEDRGFLLRLKQNAWNNEHLANKPEVLRGLEVVVFSELIVEGLLDLTHTQCVENNLINYFSDPDEALDVSVKKSIYNRSTTPLLFLLNPTRASQVIQVADSGEIMPHKSTYFFPKILTGLLINKLAGEEKIHLVAP